MQVKQWRSLCLIIPLLCTHALGQAQEKPIVISPLIGDTLDVAEQNDYRLLPAIPGFQWAVFYLNADSSLKVRVAFLQNGVKQDTIIQRYRILAALRYHLEQMGKAKLDQLGKVNTVRLLSVNAGIVAPSGKLSEFYKAGFEVGLKSLFFEPVRLVTGLLYTSYRGKDHVDRFTGRSESYQNSSVFKIFAGPQFEWGSFYVLPSLAANISGKSFRIGFDGSIGFILEIGGKRFIDLSGKYEVQNVLGTNDGETMITAVHTGVGIGFNF